MFIRLTDADLDPSKSSVPNKCVMLIAFLVSSIFVGVVIVICVVLVADGPQPGAQCTVYTSSSPPSSTPTGCDFGMYVKPNCVYQLFGCQNETLVVDVPSDYFARVATSLLYYGQEVYCSTTNGSCGEWLQFNASHSISTCDVVVDCLNNGTNQTVPVTLRRNDAML